MKEAIEKIIKGLAENADVVTVSEDDSGRNSRVSVRVDQADLGRIIGREGRTVKAIRCLMFYAGQKQGKRFQLDLVED